MSMLEKYGVSKESFKAMVRDGVIACSVAKYDDLIAYYKDVKQKNGGHKYAAVSQTAEKFKLTERWVFELVKRYE